MAFITATDFIRQQCKSRNSSRIIHIFLKRVCTQQIDVKGTSLENPTAHPGL